jgi:hypothetical protein
MDVTRRLARQQADDKRAAFFDDLATSLGLTDE